MPAADIVSAVLSGVPTEGLFTDQITPEIAQFNQNVSRAKQILVKEDVSDLKYDWQIPAEYLSLNVEEYLLFEKFPPDLSDDDALIRIERVQHELQLYEAMGLLPVLRVLIYVINTLSARGVMWGVGRGSSVSSYVLYLIGVHDIDSVKYELNITDFLRLEP